MDETFHQVTLQLEQLHKPIEMQHTFNCLFTKRYLKGKNPKPRYYFFSADQEDLIISASSKNKKGMIYKMSLNSKEIKRKSLWYVGLCSDVQTKKVFIGSFPNKPGSMSHAIKIDCTEPDIRISLSPLNVQNFLFSDTQTQEDLINLVSFKDKIIDDSSKSDFNSIKVKLGDQVPLIINQIADDEYEVQITYPLTIFQAFCIACLLTN